MVNVNIRYIYLTIMKKSSLVSSIVFKSTKELHDHKKAGETLIY